MIPPAGSWSGGPPVPQCSPVQCPPLEVASPHLRLVTLNTSYLGTATFSCPLGYLLTPPVPSIWCGHTGRWSDQVNRYYYLHIYISTYLYIYISTYLHVSPGAGL